MRECFDEGVLQSFNDKELPREEAQRVSLHLTQCEACATVVTDLLSANELMSNALALEFEGAVPTARLRHRIDAAIGGIDLRHTSVQPSFGDRVRSWFAPLGFGQPVLAYGGLFAILLVVAIIGISFFRNPAVVTPSGPGRMAEITPAEPEIKPGSSVPAEAAPAIAGAESRPVKKAPRKHPVNSRNQSVARVKLLPGEKSYLQTIAALDSTIKSNDRPMRPALRAEYERNLALVDRALAAARTAAKNNPDDPDAAEFVFSAYQSKVDLLNTVADARTYNRQQ